MEEKTEKSRLAKMPAWISSLIVLVGSILLYIALNGICSLKTISGSSFEIVLLSFYPVLIAVACFFICRAHPKSVWYTPLICNVMTIIPAFVDPDFWTTSLLWPFQVGFVLSVIGAIIGSIIGRRNIKRAK